MNSFADLLISVRCRQEFEDVIGNDRARREIKIIDFKEPSDGSLAPASPDLWDYAADAVRDRLLRSSDHGIDTPIGSGSLPGERSTAAMHSLPHLSAALGEFEQATQIAHQVPEAFRFAKMGPSGVPLSNALAARWSEVAGKLPRQVELVAVAYADHASAGSPTVLDVLRQCVRSGLCRVLIDTFQKSGESSIEVLGANQLREIAEFASANGLWWSLAGGITLEDLRWLQQQSIQPDCLGVRGAVCEKDRTSRLSLDRCYAWID